MKTIVIFLISTMILIACGHPNKNQSDIEKISDTSDSINTILTDNVNSTKTKTLNEIRFAGWTDEDWYDNDYLRELRHYFNQVHEGIILDENLQNNIQLVKSKFTIYKVEPYIMGGLFLQIIFLDEPSKIFECHVYSTVDETNETIESYEVRGIGLSDRESGFTKERVIDLIREHPEVKLY